MMTIWGLADHQMKLAEGVYSVSTPSHGGVIVSVLVADKYLSEAAEKVAEEPQY